MIEVGRGSITVGFESYIREIEFYFEGNRELKRMWGEGMIGIDFYFGLFL